MTWAWKVTSSLGVETMKFAEIMSEEYAHRVQDQKVKRYEQRLKERQQRQDISNSASGSNCITCSEAAALSVAEEDKITQAETDSEIKSDAAIAAMMQSQFDHEYNEELRRIEQQRHKQSKVTVTLDQFRRNGDLEFLHDTDEEDEEEEDLKGDWDRFETNEKKLDSIPKRGFRIDEEGKMVSKLDADLCGVRNACRIMSFPPEFLTGDGAGFDMKLSKQVYNQLKTYSRRGNSNTGSNKKSNVLVPAHLMPKEVAIKIFRMTFNDIAVSEFKQRDRYIKDDYRFKERLKDPNKRIVIHMWAEKEMQNLIRMQAAGINCPHAIMLKKHILVMTFIGDNHNAAPTLKNARLSATELSGAYKEVIATMHKLYNRAWLVHADLNEHHILWHDGKCWFIDVAQSVEPEHPGALKFLMRDCANIIQFFKKRGVANILTKEELFNYITGRNAETHNAPILERIQPRRHSRKGQCAQSEALFRGGPTSRVLIRFWLGKNASGKNHLPSSKRTNNQLAAAQR